MSRLFFALLIAASCVAAFQLAVLMARPRELPPRESPESPKDVDVAGLVVAASDLDVGDVWEDRAFTTTFPVRNRTAALIHVLDITASCSCTSVEPRSFDIPAEETKPVRLTIDLANRSPEEIGAPEREFRVAATPVVDGAPAAQRKWQLRGLVHSRVTLDTLFLHFGDSAVHDQAPAPRTVRARACVPCQTLEVVVQPPLGTVEISRVQGAEDRYVLRISPLPTLPPGPFKFEVAVNVLSSDGERLSGTALPVAGTMQPEVRALPARMFLGARPVGSTAESAVVLQVPPGAEWMVDSIDTDSPDLTVEPTAVQGAPAGRTFRVRQHVTKQGDGKSLVRFTVRKAGRESATLTMEVTYHGDQIEPSSDPEQEVKPR